MGFAKLSTCIMGPLADIYYFEFFTESILYTVSTLYMIQVTTGETTALDTIGFRQFNKHFFAQNLHIFLITKRVPTL